MGASLLTFIEVVEMIYNMIRGILKFKQIKRQIMQEPHNNEPKLGEV